MSAKRLGVFALIALLGGIGAAAVTTGLIGPRLGVMTEVKAAGSAAFPGVPEGGEIADAEMVAPGMVAVAQQNSPSQNWVRSSSEGSVFVQVELLNPGSIAKDGEINLRMYMTTHSGDLTALDLGKLIEVSIDGTSLGMPSKWAWNQASSHHPVSDISVKLPDGITKVDQLVLVLSEVGGVKVRRFVWDLNIALVGSRG